METLRHPTPLTPVAFTYACVCIVALVAFRHLNGPLQTFGATHPGAVLTGRVPTRGLLWGLGLGGILVAVAQGAGYFTPWGRRLNRLLDEWIGPLHPVDALLLAALSAFGEELIFRGLLLPYAGLWASSALFGLAHLIPKDDLWPWSVWAAGAGLLLGSGALATGGLLTPIVAHFTVNAVGLFLVGRGRT